MGNRPNRHKWMQYKFLRQYEKINRYLPETRKFSKSAFHDLLEKYGDIVVKPNDGRRGRGVYRVSRLNTSEYEIHHEDSKKTVDGKKAAYKYAKREVGSDKYIVQRRISLATVKNRPMDVRIIVQRKSGSDKWRVTGKAVKVAGEGYIVTNIARSGGTILPVKKALRKSSLKNRSRSSLMARIKKVAIRSAKKLDKLYPHHRIYGFDMGLDKNGRVWIIEVNRFPMMSHFRDLGDKDMYERIKRYKRS